MVGVMLSDIGVEQLAALPQSYRDTAVLPIGSLEQHGPHLPLGTDLLCAQALAKLIADEANAALLPPLPFTWTGGTRTYPVAINIRNRTGIQMLQAVFEAVRCGGFGRLGVVNWHGGIGSGLRIAVREYYMRTRWPVVVLKPRGGSEARARIGRLLGDNQAEGSCVLASLIILGQEQRVAPLMQRIRQAAAEHASTPVTEDFPGLQVLHQAGLVGHDYAHVCRHVAPTLQVDPQAGVAYLREYARHMAAALEALGQFQQDVEGDGPP